MKLIAFTHNNKQQVGAIDDEYVIPVDDQGPDNLIDFFTADDATKQRLEDRISSGKHRVALEDIKLETPIPRPPKFFGVTLNYADHIEETGLERPEYPTLFNKQSTCVIGPGEAIHRPRVSEKLDYEGELGIVIGKRCRHVPKDRTREVIAGYTICNDVSVRDWQARSHTWTLGKSFDTHGPIGPWIVTPDEITDPHHLDIRTWVNEELRQSLNTRHLIFDCDYLIEYLSTVMTLEPGDIIATGTSSGVGVKMKPRGYMKAGDVVRIEIEKIGVLENPVIEEPAETEFIG
jgi:2-keto-4-pentenoate hydratase/2-oxohepta-3-ene-1,7-dioic acid hydratase in catechol pathway